MPSEMGNLCISIALWVDKNYHRLCILGGNTRKDIAIFGITRMLSGLSRPSIKKIVGK
jgi:hypothetical protein